MFDVSSLPNQTVTVYLQNIATGRTNSLEVEVEGGFIELNLTEYDIVFVNNQTYKLVIKDEAGTVIDFDYDGETFNCMNLRIEPTYVVEKNPSPVY